MLRIIHSPEDELPMYQHSNLPRRELPRAINLRILNAKIQRSLPVLAFWAVGSPFDGTSEIS